jgi:cardiolipin synthase
MSDNVYPPEFLTTTQSIYERLITLCASAKQSIYVEQYIIEDDEWGRTFLDFMFEQAKRNINITLVLDSIGCRQVLSLPIMERIKEEGVHVVIYNELEKKDIFCPLKWFPRTHLKQVVIDDHTMFMGSACIAYRMRTWRDTQIQYKQDTLVKDISEQLHKRKNIQKHAPEDNVLRCVLNDPNEKENIIFTNLLNQIKTAKKYILMTTPYFIAPQPLMDALCDARARGVDVQILMSGETDIKIADIVARHDIRKGFKNGLKFHLYQQTVLHAKYTVIDGVWATLGSTNLDYLSLDANRENNIIFKRREEIQILRNHFETDKSQSITVQKLSDLHQPWYERCAGWFLNIFRRFL